MFQVFENVCYDEINIKILDTNRANFKNRNTYNAIEQKLQQFKTETFPFMTNLKHTIDLFLILELVFSSDCFMCQGVDTRMGS